MDSVPVVYFDICPYPVGRYGVDQVGEWSRRPLEDLQVALAAEAATVSSNSPSQCEVVRRKVSLYGVLKINYKATTRTGRIGLVVDLVLRFPWNIPDEQLQGASGILSTSVYSV